MAAQFRLSDEKKINSADGTTNTAVTNIYFPFLGAPYHLILHGKFQGSEMYWKFGGQFRC